MSIRGIAAATLRAHGGNVEKAIAPFLQEARKASRMQDLARVYLRMVATQGFVESGAAEQPVSPRVAEALKRPSNVKPLQIQRRQTDAERQSSQRMMAVGVKAVYDMQFDGRAIGRVKFGELATLRHELVNDAASMLEHGKKFVRDAVLAELIEKHCVAADNLAEIRTLVSEKKLESLIAQADREAPRRLAEATRRAAAAMETSKELTS